MELKQYKPNNFTDKNGVTNASYIHSTTDLNTTNGDPHITTKNIIAVNIEVNNNNNNNVNEKPEERATWGNSLEFLMSCISMSVGLGNVWRFPVTAFQNGGGAFLIPYIIVLFVIGKPMYYLEMTLGQFTSSGSVKIWEINPLLRGVGYGQTFATMCILTYYCSLIALTIYYMVVSFAKQLPWSYCRDEWGSICKAASGTINNATNTVMVQQSSSELYFQKEVLKEKDNIDDGIGWPEWKLTLCLLVAWIIIFLVISRGIKSSGKVAYFLAIFPYIVIVIIMGRAITLPGAWKGIKYFLTPQWNKILEPEVWRQAVEQCFFSLCVGMGPIIMFSSHNRFDHNIYRDTLIVTTLDTFTSLLAGVTIFAILGNLSFNLGINDIADVVKSGTTLAFVSYPDAIAKFDVVPQLFAVLFFFMLLVLGIGSAVALHSSIITIIRDNFPNTSYIKVAFTASVIGFVSGLIYATPGGQWMLALVDYFGGSFILFALAIVEVAGIFWIYGLEQFCFDLEFMVGRRVSIYWRFCWTIITPGFMIIIFVYSLIKLEDPKYGSQNQPMLAIIFGWILFSIGISQLFIWGVWLLCEDKENKPFVYRLRNSIQPTLEWGPKNPTDRLKWIAYKKDAIAKRRNQAAKSLHSTFQQKLNILLGRY